MINLNQYCRQRGVDIDVIIIQIKDENQMQYLKDRKQIEKIYEERRVDADEFPLLKVKYE